MSVHVLSYEHCQNDYCDKYNGKDGTKDSWTCSTIISCS
jgi:hypothetical protein